MITTTGLPTFGTGNAKLPDSTLTLALPSGFTCPGALQCLAMADRITGRITDGPEQDFRCYEASIEARFPSTRSSRWRNFEILKSLDSRDLADALLAGIAASVDHKTTHVRFFTGGDCFSGALRDAIITVAERTPEFISYFYTKNLPLFVDGSSPLALPENLRVTASWGGKFDGLIEAAGFQRTARVVHYRWLAAANGWPIDTTDRYAWQDEPTHFCHLTHGGQPKNSLAGAAILHRRKTGDFTGYGRRRSGATAAA